jgi:hypothetical protein
VCETPENDNITIAQQNSRFCEPVQLIVYLLSYRFIYNHITIKMTSRESILSIYRHLARLIKVQKPASSQRWQLKELNSTFRKNASLTDPTEIQQCVREAGEKIAYLRIMTPKRVLKQMNANNSDNGNEPSGSSSSSSKRWVYTKDGVVEIVEGEDGNASAFRRDGGKVVSNWDGKNLDPCAVKTHHGQLRRMGFQNNLHAKGLF